MKIPGCRYLVCAEVWFGLLTSYIMRTNMSIAIIAMSTVSKSGASNCPPPADQGNKSYSPQLHWTDAEQGVILSSYFYGYICTHILGSVSSSAIGPRYTMLISIFGAALFTYLIVYFSTINYQAVVAARVLTGFFSGPLFPCNQKILGAWAPIEERTKLVVITNTGNIAGLLAVFGFGALIIDIGPDGWKYFFYFSGSVGALCFILWALVIFDSPMTHPYITDEEKEYIMKSLHPNGIAEKKTIKNVPFLKIFLSFQVYLCGAAFFASNFLLYAFLTGHAKFLHDVYGVSSLNASLLSMIPFSVNFILQIVSSYFVNWLISKKKHSVTFYRRMSGYIGFGGAAIFIFPAGFLNCNQMGGAIALLSISMAISGVNQSGFFTTMVDLAPQYSDVITSISVTFGSAAGIITPLMTGQLTTQYGKQIGWRNSFMLTAAVCAILGVFWSILAKSKRQPWADGRKIKSKNKKSEELLPKKEVSTETLEELTTETQQELTTEVQQELTTEVQQELTTETQQEMETTQLNEPLVPPTFEPLPEVEVE